MRDGDYVIYVVQSRKTHETPWCKTQEPLARLAEPGDWHNCGDYYGRGLDPWMPNEPFRPSRYGKKQFPKASDDRHGVWSRTDYYGWSKKAYALAAAARCRKLDKQGAFDHRDGYSVCHQRYRHEFRVMRITISLHRTYEVVDEPKPKRRKRVRRG